MKTLGLLLRLLALSLLVSGCGTGGAPVPTPTPIPPTPLPPTATPTPAGVKLNYEEYAQVELIAPGGSRVLIDVWNPTGLSSPATEKDVLLTTHIHDDHLFPDFYKKFPGQQLFVKEGELVLPDVAIRGIASAHSEGDKFLPENGSNYIFIIDIGGLRIAHFGDIGQEALTDDQLKALGQVDIAITQFSNSFSQMSMSNKKGFKLMEQLKPRLIVQTHTSLSAVKYAATLWPVLYSDQKAVTITPAELPEKTSLLFIGDLARRSYDKIPSATKVNW